MTTCTISNLAREFGLPLRAIRFYESRGLIAPSRNGSHRVYTAEDRERLRQITRDLRAAARAVAATKSLNTSSEKDAG